MKTNIFYSIFAILLMVLLHNTTPIFAQGWTVSGTNTTTNPTANKVGIGTATPAEKLHVAGNVRADYLIQGARLLGSGPAVQIGNDATIHDINVANAIGIYGNYNQAVGGIKLGSSGGTLSGANGNIGIGTDSPQQKLEVNRGMRIREPNGNAGYYLDWSYAGIANGGTNWDLKVADANNVVNVMRIKSNGYIGIGTSNPIAKLHVMGGDMKCELNGGFIHQNPYDGNIEIASGNDGLSYIDFKGSTNLSADYKARILNNDDAGLSFFTNGAFPTPQMFINNGGDVGIGLDNPTAKLNVYIPPTSSPVSAQSIDVGSFGNMTNAANSYYLRMRDIGAGADNTAFIVRGNGNVGIGTSNPQYKLDICGNMRAKEIRVETGWCDYVFAKDYQLRSLAEIETFINANHHLPNIPPAATVETEGIEVASMIAKQMEKIEELTLYMIDMNKKVENLQRENEALKQQISSPKNKENYDKYIK